MNVKTQTAKDPLWTDEKGTQIPYNRTNESERLNERICSKLFKESFNISKRLADFKEEVELQCEKVYETYMKLAQNESKNYKGNFTFYNFDRSIKVEVSISDRIEFDDLGIRVCKDKLNRFIEENIDSKESFIKQMIHDAFSTQKGKLDVKKVMGLLRYKSKVKTPLFLEAMEHLENAIRRPESKKYFRVWYKDSDGSYQGIDLNFSSL